MRLPPARSLVAGCVALVGLVTLIAFQATSRADGRHQEDAPLPAAYGPVWVPEVVVAPGLPVQCADGAWTRSVVRGGCARHGGLAD